MKSKEPHVMTINYGEFEILVVAKIQEIFSTAKTEEECIEGFMLGFALDRKEAKIMMEKYKSIIS